jgi:GTP-binding protein HflX
MEVSVPTTDGAGLAWLYAHAEVLSRDDGEDAIRLTVRISPADRARFEDRA